MDASGKTKPEPKTRRSRFFSNPNFLTWVMVLAGGVWVPGRTRSAVDDLLASGPIDKFSGPSRPPIPPRADMPPTVRPGDPASSGTPT